METDYCDVTLACEDKQIKTHKLIISSSSPVLRNILKSHQTPHPLIYLRKVTYRNLCNLLNFMYQGQVDVAEEDLGSFLEVAEDLNVRGLSNENMEGIDSSMEDISTFHQEDIDQSSKNKRTAENVDNNFVEEITNAGKFVNIVDNYDNNSKENFNLI